MPADRRLRRPFGRLQFVTLHNTLVRERPDLASALYKPQPYDLRGEAETGKCSWYTMPVFTRHGDRLFVRLIRAYILSSQRHPDACA